MAIARNKDDYCDSGEFAYESGWGPPSDLLEEASNEFPHVVVKNEWENGDCCNRGYQIFHKGIVIEEKEEEVDLWEENAGSFTVPALMDTIVDAGFDDEEGNEISFGSQKELIVYCKVPDNLRRLRENFELYDFICQESLENCEERIWEEFGKTVDSTNID